MNNDDPVVDEIRKAGRELFERFNNDMAAVCDELNRHAQDAARAGHRVVSMAPRRLQFTAPQGKKVG